MRKVSFAHGKLGRGIAGYSGSRKRRNPPLSRRVSYALGQNGGRTKVRTWDPYDVNIVLYH